MYKQNDARRLAEPAHPVSGAARALREDAERTELGALWFGMVRAINRVRLGSRRWKWDAAAPGTARRNPLGAAYADALAVIQAGGREAEVCPPFDRLAQLVRGACRAAAPLPDACALELLAMKETGEADYAVRRYLAEPADSPHKCALADAAVRELTETQAARAQLCDRIRTDRVLTFRTTPRLVR